MSRTVELCLHPGKSSNVIVKAGSITVEQEVDSKFIKNTCAYKFLWHTHAEYISSLLSHGHGVCFVAEPSHADLPAFGSVTIKVTAYSDIWGEYRDQLTCNVSSVWNCLVTYCSCGINCVCW